jgi:anhydro-N-acetylmuramic acid kinase
MRLVDVRSALERGEAVVAGALSGTSGDALDVALVRFGCAPRAASERRAPLGKPELLAFRALPFPAELGQRVRAALDGAALDARALALLGRDLGHYTGASARALAREHECELALLASHGQTVYHHDGGEPSGPATLQLGEGDCAAESAGCAVACDFRQRDIAAGGQGAPIAALVDDLLFPDLPRPAAVLNLGGMGNLTLLPAADGALLAFDTGPACSLLDGLARELLGTECDRDGACAARGAPRPELVELWLRHAFFALAPPKSTGRDSFGAPWVRACLEQARALGCTRAQDVLASAVRFVARSVADAAHAHLPRQLERVVGAGGGMLNPALVRALEAELRAPFESSARHGVDPKAREALAFAALGACCALEWPLSDPGATGARAGRVLGKLCAAPPRESQSGEARA